MTRSICKKEALPVTQELCLHFLKKILKLQGRKTSFLQQNGGRTCEDSAHARQKRCKNKKQLHYSVDDLASSAFGKTSLQVKKHYD